MSDMKNKDVISKGPKKHDPTCFQTQHDIVIPAGTILRALGDDKFGAPIGAVGTFSIKAEPGAFFTDFKRVVA